MEISNKTMKVLLPICDEFKNTTILITGATGMIGQNMVEILLQMNDKFNSQIHVIAHARNSEKAEKIFCEKRGRKNFEILVSDIVNLKVNRKVDYIIHTVGVTGGSKQHIDFPMKTIVTALDGTRRVLELAAENQSRGVIYLSSLEVYGNMGFDKKSIFENDGGYISPVNVRSSYSESKRMCECMCAAYTKQYGIPTYIARLTATFGHGVSYEDKRVFAEFARNVIEKKDIVLKTTGETVRNYCDAEDAAMAFLFILAKGKPGEAYNVSNVATEISIKDLAQKFIDIFPESNISLKFDLNKDVAELGYNAVMRNVLNSEKLMELGWNPVYDIDSMLKRLVDAMKRVVPFS